jgi:hypothetical protein
MAFASAVALTPIAMVPKDAVSVATLVTPDATNGNKFFANANTLMRVKNTNASTRVVTINTNRTVEGLVVPDDTFTIAALTGDVIYSGFSNIFHQNEAGEVHIEFSAVTDVTVQVIQL